MANAIRALAMDAVEQAKSGHPGMPMGMADVATVLFTQFLRFDSQAADWPDRDRFVLSAGHGSMLLYALLHLTGYADMTIDELKRISPARQPHRRGLGRADQIAEHDRQLSALGDGCRRCSFFWSRGVILHCHDRREQFAAARKHYAEILQILCRQPGERFLIDIILAEGGFVSFKAKPAQPDRYVHQAPPISSSSAWRL